MRKDCLHMEQMSVPQWVSVPCCHSTEIEVTKKEKSWSNWSNDISNFQFFALQLVN